MIVPIFYLNADGCHGNHGITHSGKELNRGNKNSLYSVDPKEQLGGNENFSGGGCMVPYGTCQPMTFCDIPTTGFGEVV